MTKGTVLVVDDAPGIVHILQIALEKNGYRVVTAVAEETVRVACEMQPDVILLDILMPGLDGGEVSRRLHSDVRTAHIPVVALSALPETALRLHVLAMGANDYLTKPFELDDVLRHVARWVASGAESPQRAPRSRPLISLLH